MDTTPTPPATSSDVCILGTSALYVNGDSGSDSNDGSKTNPFETLKKAVTTATPGNVICVVSLSSGGDYDESTTTLTIPSGVSLYGGYNSSFVRNVTTNKTKLKLNRIGIQINNLNGDSEISDFDMTAVNPSSSSESSYAILISNGTAK
ncbi:DUF1565 domain-containing protein [Leptospira kanakyensis]|uniref:DUF1565 domain-containing protein n=1 Tax=Leptospira kanakyensis TaxID=2484968 RepID=UPI00223E661F|nr:DUF1565 domain-containing protein [Leptospira kanakyensis]MCW7468667.1 DUF1565 domain-containing protein [Leptospira kanakyensis]